MRRTERAGLLQVASRPHRGSRLPRGLLAVLAAVLFAGCEDVTSRHPLTPVESARPDPRLHGVWWHDFESRTLVDIAPGEGAAIDVLLINRDRSGSTTDDPGVGRCEAIPSVVGSRTYLNARCQRIREEKRERYDIVRYEIRKNGDLALWIMSAGPVKEAIRAGELEGVLDCGLPPREDEAHTLVSRSCDAMITAESPALAEFVAKADPAELFGDPIVLRPVRLPPRSPAKPVAARPVAAKPAVARKDAAAKPVTSKAAAVNSPRAEKRAAGGAVAGKKRGEERPH